MRGLPQGIVSRLVPITPPDGVDGHCLVWQGALNDGYGYVRLDGRMRRVHRVTYEVVRGAVPEGLVLHHVCCNKACANPDHLEAVTQQINLQRSMVVERDHRKRLERERGEAENDRDRWVRLFNRLEAAISHHKAAERFPDDHDEALWAARDRILVAASSDQQTTPDEPGER